MKGFIFLKFFQFQEHKQDGLLIVSHFCHCITNFWWCYQTTPKFQFHKIQCCIEYLHFPNNRPCRVSLFFSPMETARSKSKPNSKILFQDVFVSTIGSQCKELKIILNQFKDVFVFCFFISSAGSILGLGHAIAWQGMEQEINDTETELAEASTKSQSTENNNMETENPIEASTKLQSEINNNGDGNLVDALTKGQSSRRRTPKSLRAKSKTIEKPSANNSLKSKKAKSSPKSQGRNRKKNKDIIQGKGERNRNEHGDADNLNSSEKNVSKKERIEKGQEIRKNQERFVGSNKGQKNQKSGEKHGVLVDKSSRNKKNKGKLDEKEKNGWDEKKKEKLGGMIFMCSAKTKPDCFLYRVMGVTMNKKELILGVKPGLKLFLYDFDLKLMYGIYEASSAGGVKLEPKAFGGSFPFQVLF